MSKAKPVSLYPLSFEEALKALVRFILNVSALPQNPVSNLQSDRLKNTHPSHGRSNL